MDEYAKSVAEFHGIEVAVPTSARKRRLPKRFEECVPLSVLMPLAEMYSFDKEVPVAGDFFTCKQYRKHM